MIDFWPHFLYDFEGSIQSVSQSVPQSLSQSSWIFSSVGAKLQNVIEAGWLSASLLSVGSGVKLRDASQDDEATAFPLESDERERRVQPADIGLPTGNGKKQSNSQACCMAQLCLAAA